MATPPTFVASYGNPAISGASPKTVSVTVAAGDLVVVAGATNWDGVYLQTPTGGGLTYTLQQSVTGSPNQCNTYVWTAIAPSAQTFTLSLTGTSGAMWTFLAYVFRNHNGVGASAKKTATSTTSLSFTTQAANSAIVLVDADWNAVSGTTRTYVTSTAGAFTEKVYQSSNPYLTIYSGYYADAGPVSSETVGMSAPAGQQPSLIALEVLAAPTVAPTGSLTMTATASPTVTPPMVTINVTDTRSTSTGYMTVMRNNPDGTRTPVRTSDGNPLQTSAGAAVLYDFEAPYNAPVSYTSLEAPTVTTPQVTLAVSRPWLIHPGVPSRSMPLPLLGKGSFAKRTRAVVRGVFRPMGRANAVVVTDGSRKGVDSSMTLLVQSKAQRQALEALTADTSTLLLNIPADSPITFDACYVSVGDMDYGPVTDLVVEDWMTVTLPFTVVDRPAGGSQVARSYADILAGFGTYASVLAQYRTYADVLTGP